MKRRDRLGILSGVVAGTALAALAPEDLLARGVAINRRLSPNPGAAAPIGPFDAHQSATVDQIAELIIPATDTPGAREAGVLGFIAVMVGEWDTEEDRASFLSGLAEVDVRARSSWGRDFVDGTEAQQIGLLTEMDDEVQALRARKASTDKNFFQKMKSLTIYGYYTSEAGMTKELRSQIIPGRFDPCAAN
jgi:hypothetical protein